MDRYHEEQSPPTRHFNHGIIFSPDSPLSSDSSMNEFINDPNFTVPILEDIRHITSGIKSSPSSNVSMLIPRYYLFDFIMCVSISIAINSIILMSNLLLSSTGPLMIVQTLIQTICLSGILYMFSTADTYRSLNCSLEFLPINWISYGYSLPDMLTYLGLQILASIVGSYMMIIMYYNKIEQLDHKLLIHSILSGNDNYSITIHSMTLNIFANMAIIIGSTFIMNPINSINCSRLFVCVMSYISIIGLIYEIYTGPITFILYKIILYGAIVSVFDGIHDNQKNQILISMGVNIILKLIMYPLVAYHVKYVWSQMVRRYIEYRI